MPKPKKQKKEEAIPEVPEFDLLETLGELVIPSEAAFDGPKKDEEETDDGDERNVGGGSGGDSGSGGIGSININLGDLFKRKKPPADGNSSTQKTGETSGNKE